MKQHSCSWLAPSVSCARAGCAILALVLVAGCSRSAFVSVDSQFPSPLVEPLPVRVGLYLSEELTAYQHEEAIPQHSSWTFELGQANVNLFEPLFDGMFAQVVRTDSAPGVETENGLDGVIMPQLEKFEFDLPRGRSHRFVEVWLQYRVSVYSPDGRLVADWPVTGYGKSRASGSMPDRSLAEATVRAMREAGASISIRFRSQPAVADWLEDVRNGNGERMLGATSGGS